MLEHLQQITYLSPQYQKLVLLVIWKVLQQTTDPIANTIFFCNHQKNTSLPLKYRGIPPPTLSLSNLLYHLLQKNVKSIIGDGERKYIGYER